MDNGNVEALEIRLRRMERRFRIVTAGWLLTAVMLLVLGVAQHAVSQATVLRARAIHLVDAQGRGRVFLGADSSGPPRLQFFDEAGNIRVALSVTGFGPVLGFTDAAGKRRIGIAVGSDGAPSIELSDSAGLRRIALSLRGGSTLIFADSVGRVRIGLTILGDGSPALHLLDGAGQSLFGYP